MILRTRRSRRESSGAGGQVKLCRGFTFLEVLLVLLMLSMCATLVLPHLSGVFQHARQKREQEAISRLVKHAERHARFSGQSCYLNWLEQEHRFEIALEERSVWGVFFESAAENREIEANVSVTEFAEFALCHPDFKSNAIAGGGFVNTSFNEQTGPDLGVNSALGLPYVPLPEWDDDLEETCIAALLVNRALTVRTETFPVQFFPTGVTSGGSVFLSRGEEMPKELVIQSMAMASQWLEE